MHKFREEIKTDLAPKSIEKSVNVKQKEKQNSRYKTHVARQY